MKNCTKCGMLKDESEFYVDRRSKSFRPACKDCGKQSTREWRLHNLETAAESHKKWCDEHRDRAREICRKSWANNPETNSEWRRRNPEKVRLYNAKSKQKRQNILSDCPFPSEFKLMSCCWVCLSTERLEIDHIIPVSRGGTNDISNLTTLCKHCNTSKGNKTYEEWFQTMDYIVIRERTYEEWLQTMKGPLQIAA